MQALHRSPLLLALALAACQPEKALDPVSRHEHPAPVQLERAAGADLAALRRATVKFHDNAAAQDAGWTFVIPDLAGRLCFQNTGAAMGYHYANTGLLDGTVEAARPEAILYEPQKNGTLRLLGVEYIVPIAAWPHAEPPTLYGQQFSEVAGFGVYGLHVWVWRNNPDGMFASWNRKVSCAAAPAVE